MTDWSELIANHGGIVWKTVRRIVGDDHDASDCFQEAFVDAFEFAKTNTVSNWPGLLKRLATVRALDQLRKRMRAAVTLMSAESMLTTSSDAGPAMVAEQNELFDQLRIALSKLSSDQAAASCLRFLELMTYEEIAEHMGIQVNHVGVLLNRAKASLQIHLAAFAPAALDRTEIKP